MERNELLGAHGKLCVGTPIVITEFNLKNIRRQNLNDRSNFTTLELALRQIVDQSNRIEQFDFLLWHLY